MKNSSTDDKGFIVRLFFFHIWGIIKCVLSKEAFLKPDTIDYYLRPASSIIT